jgi:predicted nucleic-acid-binding Zn-ribbon protein
MKKGKCPKCSSNRVLPDLPVAAESGQSLSIFIQEKPRALLFPRSRAFALRAWMCSECGYTEIYAADPQKMAISYKKFVNGITRK